MRLNKLIKKMADFTKVDILNRDASRLFPVDNNSRYTTEYKIKDLKKYRDLEIIVFTQEPGIVTIYVEEIIKIERYLMKVKKFINKLQSYNYHIWITKNHFTLYEGDLKEFIECYSNTTLFTAKIKSFYFARTQGIDKIVIHIKDEKKE